MIRTFEFASALRRMSVIVKRLRSNAMEVYVKGAPEVMGDICEKDSCMVLSCSRFFGPDHATDSSPGLRRPAFLLHSSWLSRYCCRGKEYRRSVLAQSSEDETVRVLPRNHIIHPLTLSK